MILSVAFALEHRPHLLAQLRSLFVPMSGSGMLHGRVEHLVFRAGNLERTIIVAGVIPAIDVFSLRSHL